MKPKKDFDKIAEDTYLVKFSPSYPLGDFNCIIQEYNDWLTHDAEPTIASGITNVHLLINSHTEKIIAYMALCTDSFFISDEEKQNIKCEKIAYSSFPALKIGKLAIDKEYVGLNCGSYMIEIAFAIAGKFNDELGVACRFLTVDADVRFDKNTPNFYLQNGFVFNTENRYKKRTESLSMRRDIYQKI